MQDKSNSFSISWILKIAAVLLSISLISLICSYFIFSSESWNCAYNTKPVKGFGWIIEFIRSIIWVGSGIYLVGFAHREEAYQLIRFRQERIKPNLIRLLKIVRLSTIALGVVVLIIVANQQFNLAPAGLKKQAPIEQVRVHQNLCPNPTSDQNLIKTYTPTNPNDFKTYQLPYLWYSPYAFINFLFIGVPLVSIGVYSAIKDLIAIQKQKNSLQNELRTRERTADFADTEPVQCDNAIEKFDGFGFQLIETVGHYSSLILVLALIVAYEYHLGKYTLSISGLILTSIGYGLLFLAILIISFVYFYYTRVFHACSLYLFKYRCSRDIQKDFEERNNIISYLKKTLNSNLNFYIALMLLISIAPIAEIIKNFF